MRPSRNSSTWAMSRAIRALRDGLDARALTALDVVEQARSSERAFAVLDVDRAGPEREQAADEVHRLVDRARAGVRPEVAAAVVRQLAGALDAREVVGEGDLDERVALVVLEADVEARLEALDEVGLEEERLGDVVDLGDLDIGDPVDARPDDVLAARDGDAALALPVAPDAVTQALRLADVEHLARGVLHEVDAGPVREIGQRGRELGGHASIVGPQGGSCRRPSARAKREASPWGPASLARSGSGRSADRGDDRAPCPDGPGRCHSPALVFTMTIFEMVPRDGGSRLRHLARDDHGHVGRQRAIGRRSAVAGVGRERGAAGRRGRVLGEALEGCRRGPAAHLVVRGPLAAPEVHGAGRGSDRR